MIKALMTIEGRQVPLVGLSRKNCELLLAGQPIHVREPVEMVIMGGETEDAILEEIRTHLPIRGDTTYEH